MTEPALVVLRARLEPAACRRESPAEPRPPLRRPARVAQMLALAHRIERQIAAGDFADRADAARKLGLTRARVTQLCDLLLLAPDIQEEILHLESVDGIEPLSARALRPLVRELEWRRQRDGWRTSQGSQSATDCPADNA